MKLCDLYRAGDVNRWQIVKTAKQQSIAEHSFGVAMIAHRLAIAVGLPAECNYAVITWALWHDMPEIFTGDIATPLKQHIRDRCEVEPFSIFENGICGGTYKTLYDVSHVDHPEVAAVVKLADIIESIKFLDQNAITEHGLAVKEKLTTTFNDKIDKLCTVHPFSPESLNFQWRKAHEIYDEIFAIETHLDDLV